MRNEGVGSWTARRARKTPDHIALVYESEEWTYGLLHERVSRLANALRAQGVRRGDRVAYLGANHPSFLETFFACGMLGAIFVPLNARLTVSEICYQVADSGASGLVYSPAHLEHAAALRVDSLIALAGQDSTRPGYEELLAASPADPIDEPVGLEDICLIMYTSGTTGRPKGATLTHGNITWNAINVLVDQDLIADEIALVTAPLFHTAGLNMLTLPVLLKGGTCVIADRFDVDRVYDLIERRRITFMFGVPTMFQEVARSPRWADADLSSLRMLTCGGAPVPTSLIATYQERGLTFLQGYGMTEASPGTLFLDAEHAVSKAGSAGVPHFFSDVRVVDPDMKDVPPDQVGEVVVQGRHVMEGYWQLPEETTDVFTDGWFHTGDAARVDIDGYAYIVDRMKDVIISGGENVYPAEVENAVLAHPDVLDCAVVGVPDETWGEVGKAFVVARQGADLTEGEILESLIGGLAKYKIPKTVVMVPELPRNAGGKVLKSRLRAYPASPSQGRSR